MNKKSSLLEIIKTIFIQLKTMMKKSLLFRFLRFFCWGHRAITALMVIFVLIFTADFYYSRHGLPSSLKRAIIKQLSQETQLSIKIEKIHCGFWRGFSLENVEILWPQSKTPALKIKKINCSSLKILFNPKTKQKIAIDLDQGQFYLPWSQRPLLFGLNTNLTYNPSNNTLTSNLLNAKIEHIPFYASGNILLFSDEQNTEDAPSFQAITETKTNKTNKLNHLSQTLKEWETVIDAQKEVIIDNLNKLHQYFPMRNQGNITINYNVNVPQQTYQITGDLLFPNINLPNLTLQHLRGNFSLNNSLLEFKNLEISLNNHSIFNLNIGIDLFQKTCLVSGSGNCSQNNILDFLNGQQPLFLKNIKIRDLLQLKKIYCEFNLPQSESFNWQDLLIKGNASLFASSLGYQQLEASNINLTCSFDKKNLKVDNLNFNLSRDEYVNLSGVYSLQDHHSQWNILGDISLNSLFILYPKLHLPKEYQIFTIQPQIHISGECSTNSNFDWNFTGNVSSLIQSHFLPTSLVNFNVIGDQNLIKCEQITIKSLNPNIVSNFSGSLSYTISNKEIEGDLLFRGDGQILLSTPFFTLSDIQLGKTEVSLKLFSSPISSPKDWQGNIKISSEKLHISPYHCPRLNANFQFAKEKFSIHNFIIDLSKPNDKIKNLFTATGDFQYSLTNKTIHGKWQGQFQELNEIQQYNNPLGLSLSGLLSLENKQLQITTNAHLALDKIYQKIFYASKIPENDIGERIVLLGEPAHVNGIFTLPLEELSAWNFSAKLDVKDVAYKTWQIKKGNCDFNINKDRMIFSNIIATTKDEEPLNRIDLAYHFNSNTLEITGDGFIDPRFAEVFIDHQAANNFYQQIWEHLKFSKESPPHIQLKKLLLTYDTKTEITELFINADFEAKDLTYRNIPISHLTGNIDLDLNKECRLNNICITTPQKEELSGNIYIITELQPLFKLQIHSKNIDPKKLLETLNPEWGKFLGKLSLHGNHSHTCNGTITIEDFPKINLEGKSEAEKVQWGKILASNVKTNWHFINSSEIYWNITHAELWHGTISSTGTFNIDTNYGQTAIRTNRLSVAQLYYNLNQDSQNSQSEPSLKDIEDRGFFSGDFRFDIFKDWANIPLQYTGSGHCQITASNLWNTPLFTSLAKAINKNSILGIISKLDATFLFNGQQINIDFKTNGTLVALTGNGFYHLKNNQLVLKISGKALKDWRLFSWLLRPLSWLFEVELHGTPQKYKWYFIRGIKGWFSSNPNEITPDTYQDYWE